MTQSVTPLLGYGCAAHLLRLRVALCGSGAFGFEGDKATVVLPGTGSVVRLWMDGKRHLAQMYYPSGRPLSTVIDVRDPSRFASLMHNADCEIMHGAERHGTPPEVLLMADAALFSDDPAVAEAAETVARSTLPLNFPDQTPPWQPPEAVGSVLAAAKWTTDPVFEEAADAVRAVAAGAAPRAFSATESLVRWHDQVDRWLCAAYGLDPEVHLVGGDAWIRLVTEPAVVAASRRLGLLEGDVLANGDKAQLSQRLREFMAGRAGLAVPEPPLLPGSVRFYELRDRGGSTAAVAVVRDGDIQLRGPRGAEGATLAARFDSIMALRGAIGLGLPLQPPSGPR